ncbi:hypothetical protein Tco_0972887 [Tanacetum coccineum]
MFDEDVVDHIAKVLDLIKFPGVDSHRLRMKVFPPSLADDARQCPDEHDNEEGNELRQTKRKEDNENDEKPNERDLAAKKSTKLVKYQSSRILFSLDLSRLATTLNRLERSIQTRINKWHQSLLRNSE